MMVQNTTRRLSASIHRIGMVAVLPVLLLTTLLTACGASGPTPTPVPDDITIITPPTVLKPFALTTSSNTPFTAENFKGKVTVVAFGYTHCPDVCPITLG